MGMLPWSSPIIGIPRIIGISPGPRPIIGICPMGGCIGGMAPGVWPIIGMFAPCAGMSIVPSASVVVGSIAAAVIAVVGVVVAVLNNRASGAYLRPADQVAMAGIALILGVDRILDMLRTVTNVTGDCTVATSIAASEGQLRAVHPEEDKDKIRWK